MLWAQNEVGSFVETFSQQVFGKSADITEVAECVQNAQAHCMTVSRLEVWTRSASRKAKTFKD